MIQTWRERLGLGADFPLHAPTDVERAMVAEIAALRAAVTAAAPAGAPTINPMCERKTNIVIERDGYAKSGYVLRKAGADICVSDGGAVAWFTPEQWHWLMFNRMHTTFDWPKTPTYEVRASSQEHSTTAGTAAVRFDRTMQQVHIPVERQLRALQTLCDDHFNTILELRAENDELRASVATRCNVVQAALEVVASRDGAHCKCGNSIDVCAATSCENALDAGFQNSTEQQDDEGDNAVR